MNLEQAKELRDNHIKLIGMDNPLKKDIVDVIAEPVGIGENFRTNYIQLLMQYGDVSNDNLLENFKSEKYQVSVVLDLDGGMTTFGFDDINRYKSLI